MADRLLTVPLRANWLPEPIATRTNRAVKELAIRIAQHTKAEHVLLSPALNEALWKHGKKQPPARVTVLIALKDGVASARLPSEQAEPAGKAEAAVKELEKAIAKAPKALPAEATAKAVAAVKAEPAAPTKQ